MEAKDLEKSKLKTILKKNLLFIFCVGKKMMLMQFPGKYVNHSCNPNTIAVSGCDIALRSIKNGEEIISDYVKGASKVIKNFRCKCKSENCRKFV